MSERRHHATPIFLLYFLTSLAFLVFFGKLFYEREKMFIIDEARFEMRDIRREFQLLLHEKGELKAQDFERYEAKVINLRTNEVIKDDFEVKFDNRIKAPDYFDKNRIITQFRLHAMGHKIEYAIFIRGENLEPKFNALKLKIALVSFGVLTSILLIAYFIVRLSLRPLYEKIEFLNAFLRDTTHEIKTPVSVILMSAELFNSNPQKYLSNIKTAAKTIAKLYDDLVELNFKGARIGQNVGENFTKDDSANVDVSAMIDERIEYFSVQLEQKNVNLSTDIDEVVLKTSPHKLEKIIDNLLSNAAKYVDEGGEIKIFLDSSSLRIINSGDGIAAQNLDKIFELYSRFDARNGGLGVGLNLVKKFCDELGFKISCASEKKMTEFKLEFKI